jgi:hypothetical protein
MRLFAIGLRAGYRWQPWTGPYYTTIWSLRHDAPHITVQEGSDPNGVYAGPLYCIEDFAPRWPP